MPRKTYGPEQIIGMLREADVALGQGRTVGEMCRDIGFGALSGPKPDVAPLPLGATSGHSPLP